jgi:AraC-like DNA-binding protein
MPWSRVLTFTDPLPCQQAIQNADAEILPTAKGSFHAGITQIGMNRLWLQRFKISLPQVLIGTLKPDRKAFAFLVDSSSSNLHFCGMEVSPRDVFVSGSDTLHQRSAFGLHYGAMSLPLEEFRLLCKAIIGHEFLEVPRNAVVRPDPVLMSRLLKLHNIVGQLALDTPDILELRDVRRALEEQLIHALIRCLAEGANVETDSGGRSHRHDLVVARFEEFLEANFDRPLYVAEICAGIGVPERTLRKSCEEQLGMGPIRYLTLRRMHLARRALLGADPSRSTVTRIVTDHGFWELGRFSVAYRLLFGESPSETLHRPAEQTAIHPNRPSSLAATKLSGRVN